MSAYISGSPSTSRVIVLKPPAASAAISRQPGSALAAVISVLASRYGRWLIAATSPSCSAASRKCGRAPTASTSSVTRWIAAGGVSAVGVRQYTVPSNSAASASAEPCVSLPAIGCPPTNATWGATSAADSITCSLVLPVSVTTAPGARYGAIVPSSG